MTEFYKTQGILLEKRNGFRASDCFFVLFTKDFGKIEVLAKGINKPESKLCGHVSQYAISEVFIVKGRQYHQLCGSCIEKNYSKLSENFYSLFLLDFSLETINFLIKQPFPEKMIFYELEDFLDFLFLENKNNKINENSFLNYLCFSALFAYKIICLLGYGLEPNTCSSCGKKLLTDVFFSRQQGLICGQCKKNKEPKIEKKVLDCFLKKNNNDLICLNLERKEQVQLVFLILNYLEAVGEKELKIKKWIKSLILPKGC